MTGLELVDLSGMQAVKLRQFTFLSTWRKLYKNPGRILYKIPSPWKWLIAGGQLTVALITSKAFLDAPSRFKIRSQISIPKDPDAIPLNIQGIYQWIRDPFLLSISKIGD